MRRKAERSKQGQTNNKAKQHSTPKAVTFPKKNELPRVELEPYIYIYIYIYVQHNYGISGLRGGVSLYFSNHASSVVIRCVVSSRLFPRLPGGL